MSLELAVARASRRTKEGEGLRLHPYQCPANRTTIGYGRNLEDRGITQEEAEYLLSNDLRESAKDCARFRYFRNLTINRKAALIEMNFILGSGGYRQFKKMHAALACGDYPEAARQVLDSKFAVQVKGRAYRLARTIASGFADSREEL